MAKSKVQYVVVQTNSNRDHQVFGPFKKESEAEEAKFRLSGNDHLNSFEVHEVQTVSDEEE